MIRKIVYAVPPKIQGSLLLKLPFIFGPHCATEKFGSIIWATVRESADRWFNFRTSEAVTKTSRPFFSFLFAFRLNYFGGPTAKPPGNGSKRSRTERLIWLATTETPGFEAVGLRESRTVAEACEAAGASNGL